MQSSILSITSWQIEEEKLEAVTDFIFLGCKVTADGDCSQEIKSHLLFGKKAMAKLGKSIKKQRHPFPKKCLDSQSYGFSSSHVQTWELDHKEGWAPKNRCFWVVVLEKTLESPLDYKEIQPVSAKGNQPWKFIGRTDAEAEAPILWWPDAKRQLIGKDSDAGKDWKQKEKGVVENEMVGWHHQLNGHEFTQTLGDSGEQWSLACCSLWGCEESDVTEQQHNITSLVICYSYPNSTLFYLPH